jgi:hypothetical protein
LLESDRILRGVGEGCAALSLKIRLERPYGYGFRDRKAD